MLGVFPADVWSLIFAELPVSDVLRLCDLNPAMDRVGYRVLKAMRQSALAKPNLERLFIGWWFRKEAVLMQRLKYFLRPSRLALHYNVAPGVYLEVDESIEIWLDGAEGYDVFCAKCNKNFSTLLPKDVIQYVNKHQCKK